MALQSPNAAVALEEFPTVAVDGAVPAKPLLPTKGYNQPFVEDQLQQLPPEASFIQGLGAGFRSTLAHGIYDAYEDLQFNSVPDYDPTKRYRSEIARFGYSFNPDQQEFLLKSGSDDQYTYRLQQLLDKQHDQQVMGEAPVGAFVGGFADVDILAGGAGKVFTGGKAIARAAKGAAVGAAISGVTSEFVAQHTPRTHTEVLLDTAAGALGGMFEGFKGIPKFNPKLKKLTPDSPPEEIEKVAPGWTQYLSTHDKMSQYANRELADKLLANPMNDVGESVVTFSRDAHLAGERALAGFEQTVDSLTGGRFNFGLRARREQRALRNELEGEAVKWLNIARRDEEFGLTTPPHRDPRVQKIVEAYQNSGFAQDMLRRMKQAGVDGAEDIEESAKYFPVKHSYEKMQSAVKAGTATWDGIYKMYGQQISRMFPNLAAQLDEHQLGKHFVNTQKARVSDAGGQSFRGMTRNEIALFLQGAGLDESKIKLALDPLYAKSVEGSKVGNLRRRLDWNFATQYVDAKGNPMTINDFIESDMTSVLNRYNRTMSGRIGLAKMGYRSEADLDGALQEALDNTNVPRKEALDFFDNVKNSLLGRPIGEQVPDLLRTATTLGSALHLANSGIYNIADYANIAKEFGMKSVIKNFLPNLKGLGIEAVSKADAETLKAVLLGRLVAEGRMKSVVTHMEDNFEPPMGGFHEAVQYAGQSVRFLNGSEWVRRHQISMVASVLDDLTTKFAKGDTQATEYFKSLNISDDLLEKIKTNTQQHGTVLERWPSDVADEFTTHMTSATDNVALQVRNGEKPAFMQFSLAGKIVFPYMSFVAASTNKLLRREANRGGAIGVASMLIHQAPLAVLAAGLTNVINGKPFEQDLTRKSFSALPGLGAASVPLDAVMQGKFQGGITAFAPLNSALTLGHDAATGNLDATSIVKNTPGVAVFTPARMLGTLWDN